MKAAKRIIEAYLSDALTRLQEHGELRRMFRQCFLNTLDTTTSLLEDGTAFIITGDIPAMWLRDSTAQVLHYVRFAQHGEVAALLEGLLARQVEYIRIDPYANAFNRGAGGARLHEDRPPQGPWVWERKYEADSLCYPMLLAHRLYERTGRTRFLTDAFHEALHAIVSVFSTEQHHREQSTYRFERDNCPKSDTLCQGGLGAPVAYTGMTWSGFRPSDDACALGYLIPANLFAARALQWVGEFALLLGDRELEAGAARLREEITRGIAAHGMVTHPIHGEIYAYETDGMGHYELMDDANVPSLLSLPLLEVCAMDDPLYLRTRAFVLSGDNRYYYKGALAWGVGSPHTPQGYVWPIALCVQAMTARDPQELAALLGMLISTHGRTCFMHESFDPNAPENYTRPWFAWANSLFGELLYRLHEEGALIRTADAAAAWLRAQGG